MAYPCKYVSYVCLYVQLGLSVCMYLAHAHTHAHEHAHAHMCMYVMRVRVRVRVCVSSRLHIQQASFGVEVPPMYQEKLQENKELVYDELDRRVEKFTQCQAE